MVRIASFAQNSYIILCDLYKHKGCLRSIETSFLIHVWKYYGAANQAAEQGATPTSLPPSVRGY